VRLEFGIGVLPKRNDVAIRDSGARRVAQLFADRCAHLFGRYQQGEDFVIRIDISESTPSCARFAGCSLELCQSEGEGGAGK